MFNSSFLNTTQQKNAKQTNEMDSILSSTFTNPRITSTPLHSPTHRRSPLNLSMPPRGLLGPKRYLLSDNSSTSRSFADSRSNTRQVHAPGPLLAGTCFSDNVSTYVDTKSPGYAGRVVQYSEETSHATHQQKYGSAGLFPIVHLFKKDLPVISPKPKKNTIRIGSPDYLRHNMLDHNRLLLDGIVQNGTIGNDSSISRANDSTRSVLDALREISRKRIHSNEEYELAEESNKKFRKDCMNADGDSLKRSRVESPTLDTSTSPTKPRHKKLCTVDPVVASKTSSEISIKYLQKNRIKRKTIVDSPPSPPIVEEQKKKLISVETQTITQEKEKVEKNSDDKQERPDKVDEEKPIRRQVVKIFDDKPLETIRKNRLGALLGALTGQAIPVIEKEDRTRALNGLSDDEVDNRDNSKLVSILTPTNKPRRSLDKHVTFNIPDSEQTSIASVSYESTTLLSSFTTTSSSITSPIASSAVLDSPKSSLTTVSPARIDALSTPTPVFSKSSSTTTLGMPVVPKLSFDIAQEKTETTSTFISTSSIQTTLSTVAATTPTFSFGSTLPAISKEAPISTATVPTTSITPTSAFGIMTSTPSVGGFKFDLNKPSVATSPSLSFGSPSKTGTIANSSAGFTLSPGLTTSASTSNTPVSVTNIMFSNSTATNKPNGNAMFGGTSLAPPVTTSLGLGTPATTSIAFGAPSSAPVSSIGSTPFGVPTTTTPSAESPFTFGSSNTAVPSTSSTFGAINTSTFGVTAPVTSASPFAFGGASTTATPASGVTPSTTAFMFKRAETATVSATSSAAPTFAFGSSPASVPSAVPNNPMFGSTLNFAVPTTSAPSFGNNSITSPFGIKPSVALGSTTTQSTFGSNTTFGATTTASTTFGTGATHSFSRAAPAPTFGTNSIASSFGAPPTTNASLFGGVPTTSSPASGFGGFGAPTTTGLTSQFGTPSVAPPTFGAPTAAAPAFGAPTTAPPAYGTPTKTHSAFGVPTTAPPAFGVPTTASPAFGTVSTTLSFAANPPAFGSTLKNNIPSFNASFGATTASSVAFGSAAPTFGAVTTASTGFGAPSASTFGVPTTSNGTGNTAIGGFGSTSGSSAFKFGGGGTAPGANPFGSVAPTNTFGGTPTTTAASGFGSTALPSFNASGSVFGGNNNTLAPAFGAASGSVFGQSNAAPSFGSTGANFGSSSNNAFGSPGTGNAFGNNVPSNGFGSGIAPSSMPSFGSGAAPAAQNGGVFAFGSGASAAPASQSGVFAFGSAEAPKPSFNFSAGSNPPAFGATPPPAFGNGLNVPAPSGPGMFTIGSGPASSNARSRTQLKAKRRT